MNYYEIVDHIQKTKPVSETTTMDAVAFLPSHLGVVKADASFLAKKKLDWHIEILEQEDSREVWFEKDYHITVPNEHWDVFCSIFDSVPTNNTHLNLKSLLNETLEDEMKDLRRELKVSLARLFDSQDFKQMDKSVNSWKWRFPTVAYETKEKASVAVTHESKKSDIQNLYQRLLESYGEDRGGLEMLTTTLKDNMPLNTFDILKGYDHIFGTRIHSKYEGIDMFFESLLGMDYQLTQSIYTDSDELLGKVEEESDEVKVVKHVIYPKGGVFTFRFMRLLSDIIEDVGTEQEEEQE